MVVDDCADVLDMQKTILELDGYAVVTATSGKEALAHLTEMPRPQLILADVIMQDMSGPEFLAKVESEFPELIENVPFVFLSGSDDVPIGRAVGFIRKPVGMDLFLDAVHYFLERGPKTDPVNASIN